MVELNLEDEMHRYAKIVLVTSLSTGLVFGCSLAAQERHLNPPSQDEVEDVACTDNACSNQAEYLRHHPDARPLSFRVVRH